MSLFQRWRSPAVDAPCPVSRLGSRSILRGEIRGPGDVSVHGRLDGSVVVPGRVEVAAGGFVGPRVSVAELWVAGRLDGRIEVRGRLVAEAGGVLGGEIRAARWQIEEGALMNGRIDRLPGASED